MFKHSDTRWANWTVIAAGDEQAARISAMQAIAKALEKAVPAEPPRPIDNLLAMAPGSLAAAGF